MKEPDANPRLDPKIKEFVIGDGRFKGTRASEQFWLSMVDLPSAALQEYLQAEKHVNPSAAGAA